MSVTFELNAELRSGSGTGASRRLRRDEKVPAVLYGAEKEPVRVALDHNTVLHSLENEAFYSHILTVKFDGREEKVVLKDLQRHPSKPRVMHMDFQRVSDATKIRMQVPLHFVGEDKAPGVKQSGGTVAHLMNNVEVICLAKNLPEFIEADLSELETGVPLRLSELTLPEGVQVAALLQGAEHDLSIAVINKARGAEEEEALVAGESEVEGEGEGA